MAQQILGIGMHDGWIALTRVRKGLRGTEVLSSEWFPFANQELPEEQKQRFVERVTAFLKAGRFDPDQTVVGLPRRDVTVRILNLPAPDKSTLDEIIRLELDRNFAVPVDKLMLAYHVSPPRNHVYPVIVAGIKKEVFEMYGDWMSQAGIPEVVRDISLSGQVNILQSALQQGSGLTAMLNVGPGSVEVSLCRKEELLATRVVPLSVPGFGEAFFVKETSENQKTDSVAASVHSITGALKETLDGCQGLRGEESVERIYVFGGGCFGDELVQQIEAECSVPTHPAHLPEFIRNPLPEKFDPGFQLLSLAWAMTPLQKQAMKFEFTGIDSPRKQSRLKWAVAAGLVLVVMGLWTGISFYTIHGYEQTLASLDRQMNEVKTQASRLQEIDRKYSDLIEKLDSLNEMESRSPLKLPVFSELSRILPKDTWITGLTIRGRMMKITGYSRSASKLIQALEDSPAFQGVAFQGAVVKQGANEKFSIQMNLETRADENPES